MTAAAAVTAGNWLAAEGGGVDVAVLTQYGVLGVFAAMLVLFARVSYKRETDRADRLEEDNKRLHETIADRVIPAVMSATRAVEESAELLNAVQREREIAMTRRFAREDSAP